MADKKREEIERATAQAEFDDLKQRYHELLKENEELKKKTSIRSRLKDIFFGQPEWLTAGDMDRQHSVSSSRDDEDDSELDDEFLSERHPVEASKVRISGSFGGSVETSRTDKEGKEVRNVYEIAMPVEGDVPYVSLAPFLTQMKKAVHARVAEKEAELQSLQHEKREGKKLQHIEEEVEHLRTTVDIWETMGVLLHPEEKDAEEVMPATEKEKFKTTIKTLKAELKASRDELKIAGEASKRAISEASSLEGQVSELKMQLANGGSSQAATKAVSLTPEVKDLQQQLTAARNDAARWEQEASQLRLKNDALRKFLESAESASLKIRESIRADTAGTPDNGAPRDEAPPSWIAGPGRGAISSSASSATTTPPRQRNGVAMEIARIGAQTGPLRFGAPGRTHLLDPNGVLQKRPTSRTPTPSGRSTPKDEILKDQVRELERWALQLKALHK